MAKTKISEWSTTPSSNTDIDGINIAEGCAPSGINDAIRDMMAQIRSWQSGTYGDTFNGPVNGTVGATTPATGAFTTLSASSTVTLSGGTANGVTYLNGSKVLTSGSALTFDGASLRLANAVGTTANGLRLDGGAQVHYWYLSDNTTSAFEIGSGAGQWKWLNSNGEQMRLTSTGLGIGTSSPAVKLDVAGAVRSIVSGGTPIIYFNNGSTQHSISNSSGAMPFEIAGVERMRLDSSGNLGLGVTPSAWYSLSKAIEIGAGGAIQARTNDAITFELTSNAYLNTSGNWIYKTTNRASLFNLTNGAYAWNIATSGTAGNAITFTQAMTLDANGVLLVGRTSPSISGVKVDAEGLFGSIKSGNWSWSFGASSATNAFVINDTTSGSSVERARIDSSGNLLVGTTALGVIGSSNGFRVDSGGTINTVGAATSYAARTATDGAVITFRRDTTTVGSISVTTTATAYNTSSDQRLKENIQDADSASGLIDSLQVRKFDWKADGSHQRYGFVAQELVTVAPEAVHQPEDTEEMMAVDYSKLVPMLVKEVQSLRKRLADAGL
jgi:hypothetical protein